MREKSRAIQGGEMENSHDKDVGDIGVLATAVYVRSAVTILFLPDQCVWVEARSDVPHAIGSFPEHFPEGAGVFPRCCS